MSNEIITSTVLYEQTTQRLERLGIKTYIAEAEDLYGLILQHGFDKKSIVAVCQSGISRSVKLNRLLRLAGLEPATADSFIEEGANPQGMKLNKFYQLINDGGRIVDSKVQPARFTKPFDTVILFQSASNFETKDADKFIGGPLQILAAKNGVDGFENMQVIIVPVDERDNDDLMQELLPKE